jgi:hypothetical protein
MSWIRFKTLNANLIVFIFILFILEISSFFIFEFKFKNKIINTDRYNISDEQDGFYSEVEDFGLYEYKAFIEWKANKKSGIYINIDEEGRRYSSGEKNHRKKIALFGGSAMWGYGVADRNTIPSIMGSTGDENTINYAEQAYNSRQNLNLLINQNNINSGDKVVFYDGVNDVYHNCLAKNSTNGHAREGYIKMLLNTDVNNFNFLNNDWKRLAYKILSYSWTVKLIYATSGININKLASKNNLMSSRDYICEDKKIAENVANFIITSWSVTEKILNSDGIFFSCILQPNPYTLNVRPHYYDELWMRAVNDVYPIIREKAKQLNCFIDASDWLDYDYYIDSCCHLNREGNAIIARKLKYHLN